MSRAISAHTDDLLAGRTGPAHSGFTLILDEESVRVRAKIAEGLAVLGWEIPDGQRDAVRKVLPPQYGINGLGSITKR